MNIEFDNPSALIRYGIAEGRQPASLRIAVRQVKKAAGLTGLATVTRELDGGGIAVIRRPGGFMVVFVRWRGDYPAGATIWPGLE